MKDTPDESRIVKEVASLVAKRITAKVILEMRRVKHSGSFLANHWERFCAQVHASPAVQFPDECLVSSAAHAT